MDDINLTNSEWYVLDCLWNRSPQTVMELEKRVVREIIVGYEDVTVTASEDDPTVCLVEFAFTVAHGLNQVWLSAHITV